MSTEYYRDESTEGDELTEKDKPGLSLTMDLMTESSEKEFRIREAFSDEPGCTYLTAGQFDRACRLEELNILRRIALVLEKHYRDG